MIYATVERSRHPTILYTPFPYGYYFVIIFDFFWFEKEIGAIKDAFSKKARSLIQCRDDPRKKTEEKKKQKD